MKAYPLDRYLYRWYVHWLLVCAERVSRILTLLVGATPIEIQ